MLPPFPCISPPNRSDSVGDNEVVASYPLLTRTFFMPAPTLKVSWGCPQLATNNVSAYLVITDLMTLVSITLYLLGGLLALLLAVFLYVNLFVSAWVRSVKVICLSHYYSSDPRDFLPHLKTFPLAK